MNSKLLTLCNFQEELHAIQSDLCPICKKQIIFREFKDQLSIKEFYISGMCQKCQDQIFEEEQ